MFSQAGFSASYALFFWYCFILFFIDELSVGSFHAFHYFAAGMVEESDSFLIGSQPACCFS